MQKCPPGYLYCRNWHTAGVSVQNARLRLFRHYLCFNVRVAGLLQAVWKAVSLQHSSFQGKGCRSALPEALFTIFRSDSGIYVPTAYTQNLGD